MAALRFPGSVSLAVVAERPSSGRTATDAAVYSPFDVLASLSQARPSAVGGCSGDIRVDDVPLGVIPCLEVILGLLDLSAKVGLAHTPLRRQRGPLALDVRDLLAEGRPSLVDVPSSLLDPRRVVVHYVITVLPSPEMNACKYRIVF